MKQEKKKQTKQEGASTEDLKKQFESAKAVNTQTPKTRTVKMIMSSCCGCGCAYYDVTREVPWDSPLKNGQSIHSRDVLDTDKVKLRM